VKQIDFINEVKSLKTFKPVNYDHIINLYENSISTSKIFYINSLFNSTENFKQNTKNLLSQLSEIYNVQNYKIFFSRKKKIKCKHDLFICWNTDEEWKIKRYPFENILEIKKNLEKKYNIKIKVQKQDESLSKYIENIKYSKIVLSVMTLGVHIAMIFDKELVVLIGPNNYDDLNLYKKAKVILPENKCEFRPCNLPTGVNNCGCMPQINQESIIKIISEIYEKIS
jgi:ADP-heptose:LPS heptosyltransferase